MAVIFMPGGSLGKSVLFPRDGTPVGYRHDCRGVSHSPSPLAREQNW